MLVVIFSFLYQWEVLILCCAAGSHLYVLCWSLCNRNPFLRADEGDLLTNGLTALRTLYIQLLTQLSVKQAIKGTIRWSNTISPSTTNLDPNHKHFNRRHTSLVPRSRPAFRHLHAVRKSGRGPGIIYHMSDTEGREATYNCGNKCGSPG